MKTIVNFLGLLSLALFLITCQQEEEPIESGHIQFQLDQFLDPHSSGRIASSLPAGSSLLISISDNSDNAVLTFERIEILTLGTSSVSTPIRLSPGSYKLVDFLVVNKSNEVLYATPKGGSPLAKLVSRPLPFSFSVWKERVTNVTTQVVRAEESTAEDFGYASFHIDIAAFPEFRLAVLAPVHGNMTLVDADVSLVHGTETIYSKHLPGLRINEVIFKGDQSETYTLMVKKDGYKISSQTFVLSELRATLQGNPLEVVLTPALTFEIVYGGSEYPETTYINFEMNGADGKKVVINWGDGTADSIVLTTSDFWNTPTTFYYHTYQNPGDFKASKSFISVSGDIEAVQLLRFGWDISLHSISLQHLSELTHLGIHFQGNIQAVDVSENHALQLLGVSYHTALQTVMLGDNPELLNLYLSELPLSTAAIDQVIDRLHASIQNHPRRDGIFDLYNYNNDDFVFIGPPTSTRIEKLQSMENDYGWSVSPSPW